MLTQNPPATLDRRPARLSDLRLFPVPSVQRRAAIDAGPGSSHQIDPGPQPARSTVMFDLQARVATMNAISREPHMGELPSTRNSKVPSS